MLPFILDDFLRRRFISMSYTAEIFHSRRTEFAKSCAVSSIYGYVCGIGDRHLKNLLVDKVTGSLVQIDFDMCFGKGALQLPVPEFIPFRLSPQMISVLRPLDGSILLRGYMVAAMKMLRSKEAVQALSNALEIYLNDPVADWINADKAIRNQRGIKTAEGSVDDSSTLSSEREDINWLPRRRIEGTLRKLMGMDPASLLLDDLKDNTRVKKYKSFIGLQNILRACTHTSPSTTASSMNYMYRTEHDKLSVENQVDVLMKLATDPDILVRQWSGLTTWI